jgi:hypothetical protein
VKSENVFGRAAKLLRAKGVAPSSRSVSHLVRLARSFQRERVGRYEALYLASFYIGRGKLKN